MSDFKLDTSGAVPVHGRLGVWTWPDLSPFEQGYAEAMLTLTGDAAPGLWHWCGAVRQAAFRWLAPETLARIREDCQRVLMSGRYYRPNAPESGATFWARRQRGDYPVGYPALTVYLGDDGNARFQ